MENENRCEMENEEREENVREENRRNKVNFYFVFIYR